MMGGQPIALYSTLCWSLLCATGTAFLSGISPNHYRTACVRVAGSSTRASGVLGARPPSPFTDDERRSDRQSLVVRATSVEGDFDADAIARARQESESGSVKAKLRALYKFTRPHTIRGTILASVCGTIRALVDTPGVLMDLQWQARLPRALIGMAALLLGNAFIVGINQIYDVSIDRLNKPFLPVASGEMSKRFAWIAVVTSAVVGPLLVRNFFPPLLFQLYSFGLFLGLVYSVPPIRTKKNPILAGLTIACVRGFLLNFGVYYAVKDTLGETFSWSPKVAFIARFMTVFATVIAVTKDMPDIEGDKVRGCLWSLFLLVCLSLTLCFSGLRNRNVCYKDWCSPHCKGRYVMLVSELCTCGYDWCFSSKGRVPCDSDDWRPRSIGLGTALSLSSAETGFHGLHQVVLQKHLGSLLSRVHSLHVDIRKS
jgi:homogentisate solanesyltransferase